MTTKTLHRLAICGASLALVVASKANAACADCVPVTFNVNINVANLHPSVTAVQVRCNSAGAEAIVSSERFPVVNRGFVGQATLVLNYQLPYILAHLDNGVGSNCDLWFEGPPGPAMMRPMTIATQPILITESNWRYISSGSKIATGKEFKFPNVATP